MIVILATAADARALAQIPARARAQDDASQWLGLEIKKPWGSEYEFQRTKQLAMWRLKLRAGAETSMHCHPGKMTLLELQSGEAVLKTLERDYPLFPGTVALIEAGAFHRTWTPIGADLVEVEWPPNKLDLVRLDDRYGRAGMPYEVPA